MKRPAFFFGFIVVAMLFLFLVFAETTYATSTRVYMDGVEVEFDNMVVRITTPGVPPEPIPPEPIPPEPIPPEPPGGCDATLPIGTTSSWRGHFGDDFPGPKSRLDTVAIPRNSYRAVPMYVPPGLHDSGAIRNREAAGTEGTRLMAISRCPGDFNVASECKMVIHTYEQSILWSTWMGSPYCTLKKGVTYYWNTTFTNGVDSGSSTCRGTYCNTVLRVGNNDYTP